MKLLIIILLIVVSGNLYAQDWNQLQFPNETKHAEDLFTITRPALSLRGWDNTRTTNQTSYFTPLWNTTRGVKQVLSQIFSENLNTEKELFIDRILVDYVKTITTGYLDGTKTTHKIIDTNADILESRAFTALMTYIIEKNDGGTGEPNVFTTNVKNRVVNLPSFDQARSTMLAAFRQLLLYHFHNSGAGTRFFTDWGYDQTFKNTTAIMSVARAFDFYLALENAALFFNDTSTLNQLLSSTERKRVNAILAKEIDFVHYQTSKLDMVDNQYDQGSLNIHLDELQAGNWPLISKIGIAYASLGMNGVSILNSVFNYTYFYNRLKDGIIASSPVRTASYESDIRKNHFYYQTQGNTSFAEGFYYYKITLQKLIPFYNVLRTNARPELVAITGITDPIRHPNFEKTLHWVADLTTPDGKILPIDDGNKTDISISEIMRWSNQFGNEEIGNKYAWI